MRHAVLLVIALVVPRALRAQKGDCSDPSLSMVEIDHCLDARYAKADADLNATYRRALAALPDTAQRAALVRSEQAWLASRDAERALRNAFAGGNHRVQEVLPSVIAMVETRLRALRSLADEHYPAIEKVCP